MTTPTLAHVPFGLDRGTTLCSGHAPTLLDVADVARPHGPTTDGLVACWAADRDDIRQAQSLRHQVFIEELGARIQPPHGTPAGLDADLFDEHCEHLIVRPRWRHGGLGPVIATSRLLTPKAATRLGAYYTETEFDLTRLRPLRAHMAELGRTCVDPSWRSGSAVITMWGAIATFMQANGFETLIGCASVSVADGGHTAASLWQSLSQEHLADISLHVRPRLALPLDSLRVDLDVTAPPLIKGYLRAGAELLGPPAWDPDFGTADLPLLLRVSDLRDRYRRRLGSH